MDNDLVWNLIAKKLSGEATPEELLDLEQALRSDPDLHYSLEAIQDLWRTNPGPQNDLAEKAFAKHLEKMQAAGSDYFREETGPFQETSREKYSRAFRTAGISIFSLLLFAGIFQLTRPHPLPAAVAATTGKKPSEVVTQNGTRTKLLLPDGTSVWLNAGSRLLYDSTYGNTSREVSLSGEAFFDVKKNKDKFFIIHIGNINIKVLGTSFNVKSYPEDKTIETSLILGKIEVSFKDHSQEKVILRPNQKLVIPSEAALQESHAGNKPGKPAKLVNLSHFGPDSLISETAWVENTLVFQDESFAQLAKKMERWYGARIIFDDKFLDTLHFTGSFEKETMQQALIALQTGSSSGFHFTIHNSEAHIKKTE